MCVASMNRLPRRKNANITALWFPLPRTNKLTWFPAAMRMRRLGSEKSMLGRLVSWFSDTSILVMRYAAKLPLFCSSQDGGDDDSDILRYAKQAWLGQDSDKCRSFSARQSIIIAGSDDRPEMVERDPAGKSVARLLWTDKRTARLMPNLVSAYACWWESRTPTTSTSLLASADTMMLRSASHAPCSSSNSTVGRSRRQHANASIDIMGSTAEPSYAHKQRYKHTIYGHYAGR